MHIDKLGNIGKLQIFNNVKVIKKNFAQQFTIGYDQTDDNETVQGTIKFNSFLEEQKKQFMKNYANIYVKINKFDQRDPNDPRKKLTFKGKYSQTFIYEDDFEILKNQIYCSPKLNLIKKNEIHEFETRQSYKCSSLATSPMHTSISPVPNKSVIKHSSTIKDSITTKPSVKDVNKGRKQSIGCDIGYDLERLMTRHVENLDDSEKGDKKDIMKSFKTVRSLNSSPLRLYAENKKQSIPNFTNLNLSNRKLTSKNKISNSDSTVKKVPQLQSHKKSVSFFGEQPSSIIAVTPMKPLLKQDTFMEHKLIKKESTICSSFLQRLNNSTIKSFKSQSSSKNQSFNKSNIINKSPRDYFSSKDFFYK